MSSYSSSLTNTSVFIRPGQTTGQYYYKAIQFVVSTSAFYRFTSVSRIDMYGYLYTQYFNATAPYINLLTYNNDSGGNRHFSFEISLQSNNFLLMATEVPRNVTEPFFIVVFDPVNITFR
jgi:hypothetical protein